MTRTDTRKEMVPETEQETVVRTEIETEIEGETEITAEIVVGVQIGAETEKQVGTETGAETEILVEEVEVTAETQIDPEIEVEVEIETIVGRGERDGEIIEETAAGAVKEKGAEIEAEIETEVVAETEIGAVTEVIAETEIGAGAEIPVAIGAETDGATVQILEIAERGDQGEEMEVEDPLGAARGRQVFQGSSKDSENDFLTGVAIDLVAGQVADQDVQETPLSRGGAAEVDLSTGDLDQGIDIDQGVLVFHGGHGLGVVLREGGGPAVGPPDRGKGHAADHGVHEGHGMTEAVVVPVNVVHLDVLPP